MSSRSTTMPVAAMIGPTASGVVLAAITVSGPSAWAVMPGRCEGRERRAASGVRTRTDRGGSLEQLAQRAPSGQAAGRQDEDVVDGLGRLGQQVRRHEHDAALGRVPAQEAAHPRDALGVEAVGGLVEDQDVGVAEQGPGQLEALAHAHREAAHLAPGVGLPGRPSQHLVDALSRCRPWWPWPADGRAPCGPGGSPTPRAPRRPCAAASGRCAVGHAVDKRLARGRRHQPEQHAQRRGLAGAVRARGSR